MNGINSGRVTTAIALVSTNHLLRFGLQKLVESEKWIQLIDYAATSMNIEDMLSREKPHIMIIDLDIESDVSGLVLRIKAAAPQAKTILLSGFDNMERTRQAIGVGVDGIVLKIQPSAVLIATIAHLACPTNGKMPPPIAEAASVSMRKASDGPIPIYENPGYLKWTSILTEREREVIRLISQGLSNKDIADRLCISSITVRHHLTNLFDKLGVSNRQKLLVRAHQCGIVELTAQA